MPDNLNITRVLVAHPGTQHSYQTALALQEAGFLHRYVTGFYYKDSVIVSALISLLPEKYSNSIARLLLRRRNDELRQDLILTIPIPELIFVISSRLKLLKNWSDKIMWWRNRRFDRGISKMIVSTKPEALICYNSCAINAFKACAITGTVSILDQSVGHIKSYIKILQEEAELHPEFADQLSMNTPDWLVNQCTIEAMNADMVLVASEFVKSTMIDNLSLINI